MFCPKCAAPNLDDAAFCRKCGFQIAAGQEAFGLDGHAIAKFLVGDLFVLPGVLLMALESSVQSALWILLAIPGIVLYTWAIADIVKSRSMSRKSKKLPAGSARHELPAAMPIQMPNDRSDLRVPMSVTERTTRDLA